MLIQFKKGGRKPSILTVIRSDGSSTWTPLRPGLESHDLAHYAVESILGYRQAFYGLLDQGYTVADFEKPREQRPTALIPANLPLEALQTEFIVNQLQVDQQNPGPLSEFLATLATSLRLNDVPFPTELTAPKLQEIQSQYLALIHQWKELSEGEVLELPL